LTYLWIPPTLKSTIHDPVHESEDPDVVVVSVVKSSSVEFVAETEREEGVEFVRGFRLEEEFLEEVKGRWVVKVGECSERGTEEGKGEKKRVQERLKEEEE